MEKTDNSTLLNSRNASLSSELNTQSYANEIEDSLLVNNRAEQDLKIPAKSDIETCTLQDIFGVNFANLLFSGSVSADAPPDPALINVEGLVAKLFGGILQPQDLLTVYTESDRLPGLRKKLVVDQRLSVLEDLFGKSGSAFIRQNPDCMKAAASLEAAYPFSVGDGQAQAADLRLLLKMPTVFSNRQVLHADPVPFNPHEARPLESSARRVFTPQNSLLWATSEKSGRMLSNSRVIQWSDGTMSLHVGAESYNFENVADAALTFIGRYSPLEVQGKEVPAIVETLPVDGYVTVCPFRTGKNSVNALLAAEAVQRQQVSIASQIGMVSPLVELMSRMESSRGSAVAEYVRKEENLLQRHFEQRAREGNPVELHERLLMENAIVERVKQAIEQGSLNELAVTTVTPTGGKERNAEGGTSASRGGKRHRGYEEDEVREMNEIAGKAEDHGESSARRIGKRLAKGDVRTVIMEELSGFRENVADNDAAIAIDDAIGKLATAPNIDIGDLINDMLELKEKVETSADLVDFDGLIEALEESGL